MDVITKCDYKGYKNNIGNVINPISILWSLGQSKSVQDYINVMSIVGSITIDFAKHRQEANIPKEMFFEVVFPISNPKLNEVGWIF